MVNVLLFKVVVCLLVVTRLRSTMCSHLVTEADTSGRDSISNSQNIKSYFDRIELTEADGSPFKLPERYSKIEDPRFLVMLYQMGVLKEELRTFEKIIKSLTTKLARDYANRKPEIKVEPKKICQDGFEYDPKGSSCYKVIYERHNRTSAAERCQQLNPRAHLVSITSREESHFLRDYLSVSFPDRLSPDHVCVRPGTHGDIRLWLSGQRHNETDCGSRFLWKTTTENQTALDFTNWQRGEPNCSGGGEGCMVILPEKWATWNDVACHVENCPFCEYDPK